MKKATRLDRESAPARQVGGDDRETGMRQERDSPCEEGHEESGLREVWPQQHK